MGGDTRLVGGGPCPNELAGRAAEAPDLVRIREDDEVVAREEGRGRGHVVLHKPPRGGVVQLLLEEEVALEGVEKAERRAAGAG